MSKVKGFGLIELVIAMVINILIIMAIVYGVMKFMQWLG